MKITRTQLRRIIREEFNRLSETWSREEVVAYAVPPGGVSPNSRAYVISGQGRLRLGKNVIPWGETPEEHREALTKIAIAKVTHVADDENLIGPHAPGALYQLEDWRRKVDAWLEGASYQ